MVKFYNHGAVSGGNVRLSHLLMRFLFLLNNNACLHFSINVTFDNSNCRLDKSNVSSIFKIGV